MSPNVTNICRPLTFSDAGHLLRFLRAFIGDRSDSAEWPKLTRCFNGLPEFRSMHLRQALKPGSLSSLNSRPRGRAFRSRCQPHRKPESQRDVIGCETFHSHATRRPLSCRKWPCVEISKIPAPPLTKGAKTAKSPHSAPFWHLLQVLSVGGQNIFIFSKPSRFH